MHIHPHTPKSKSLKKEIEFDYTLMNTGYHILIYSNCYVKINTCFGLVFINFVKLSILLNAFNKVFHFFVEKFIPSNITNGNVLAVFRSRNRREAKVPECSPVLPILFPRILLQLTCLVHEKSLLNMHYLQNNDRYSLKVRLH